MNRYYYSNSIKNFIKEDITEIIGQLAINNEFNLEQNQRDAWIEEIRILRTALRTFEGSIYLEYSIPRMGKRIDAVIIIKSIIFILEFKVGEKEYSAHAIDQVYDYALDLKNFHEESHSQYIVPILIATNANNVKQEIALSDHQDKTFIPIKCNQNTLIGVMEYICKMDDGNNIDSRRWETGRYSPTPTIVEAAMALYNGHSVHEISRSDAGAQNLKTTAQAISDIINISKERSQKSICFVTGVPGAGKTLVGLNIATKNIDKDNEMYSVFLSGNGPLVSVLREALTRDKVKTERERGKKIKKTEVASEVKMFIQNVHHFRDDCLVDDTKAPIEHVALFDEAQRAWNIEQTRNYMRRKKNISNFDISEPEFLISCLDRHKEWAVIVCLVGGGQEINTGEASIGAWIEALNKSYPDWHVYISPKLTDTEYTASKALEKIQSRENVSYDENLHLSVSLRSFRAEKVSLLVKQILDMEKENARETLRSISCNYPMVLTRNLKTAKNWLRKNARGSERYGLIVSSNAERLKPHAIDVKSPIDPIHWFLDDKGDVRSSYYLEQVATEFHIQGLELDWACVTWDADFRYTDNGWLHKNFCGDKWKNVDKTYRKTYLKNAYRVLLTRARQGMVIVVPEGDLEDPTRKPEFYDPTYCYLKDIGFKIL